MTNRKRAMELAALLGSNYPGRSITDANILMWFSEFERMDEGVAERVVERLREQSDDPPSAATVIACERSVSGSYDFGNQGARPLPPGEMGPEERERSREFFVAVREEMYRRHPDWRRSTAGSMFNESVEEKIERTRALARIETVEEELPPLSMPRMRQGPCAGSGKAVAKNAEGKDVCPDCGVEIEPMALELTR